MYVKTAECSRCGKRHPSIEALTLCQECNSALLFKYDLNSVSSILTPEILKKRKNTFWKFIELLPLSSQQSIVSLGEPYTPILHIPGKHWGFTRVFLKDEGRMPSGTFKARGMAVAVSCLKESGVEIAAIPSAGNAAAALALYGAKGGLKVVVFMPRDVPRSMLGECILGGARVFLVDGLISHAGKIVGRLAKKYDWFDMSTSKQPYRFEGYKVMAFELVEQLNWKPPNVILFPTGGGEGIIGLWKGFKELKELGWISQIPRLIAVQSEGCAPLVEAFVKGQLEVEQVWDNAETIATGLKVPKPFASHLVLKALRETRGAAVAVNEDGIAASMKTLFKIGISACPEAASTLAALKALEAQGVINSDDEILLFITGTAMKYWNLLEASTRGVDIPVLSKDSQSLP